MQRPQSLIAAFALAVLCASPLFAQQEADQPPVDESAEPPIEFMLKIGDQSVPIELDKPIQLEAGRGQETVTLTAKPTRHFRRGQVEFHYPRYYTYEADVEDPELSMWTLSGNTHVIMLMRYPSISDHTKLAGDIAQALTHQYGEDNVETSDAVLKLDKQKLAGTRMKVTLAGEPLRQDVFSFANKDAGYVLILQDSPDEEGSSSDEGQKGGKIFQNTFRFSE